MISVGLDITADTAARSCIHADRIRSIAYGVSRGCGVSPALKNVGAVDWTTTRCVRDDFTGTPARLLL